MAIKENVNVKDVYTNIYVKVKGANELKTSSDKYKDLISDVKTKIEDIKDKTEVNNSNTLDFSSVRKKAFGEIESLEAEPKETFYEETVTVKLQENPEEKKQKEKTIDELLEDTADVEINVDKNDKNKNNTSRNVSDELDDYEKIDEDLEEIIPENKSVQEEKVDDEDDDTLENDLFELIDSMYDNREDGDY